MIRTITLIVLIVHGIGHLQGVVVSLGLKAKEGWNSSSWLLGNFLSSRTTRYICLGLYLVSAILGMAAALSYKGILIPSIHWQNLALVTAIISTIALISFPKAFAQSFNKIGAIAVNLVIYYSILLGGQWPSEVFSE